MDIASNRLHVMRIRREGNINHTKELDKEIVQEITNDPLMKYSSVMSGLFHERVIICEADADCLFYSTLLDTPQVNQGYPRDILFVHANGKHQMATLTHTLRALDVPVDVIADIDILRDETDLKKLVESLGGDWTRVQPLSNSVRSAVEQRTPPLDSAGIQEAIKGTLQEAPLSGEFPRNLRSQIESTLRKGSPWESIKSAGKAALPPGQAAQRFQELQEFCNGIGLWIVPVGELEGFCRTIGGHGPRWVQQVIEQNPVRPTNNSPTFPVEAATVFAGSSGGSTPVIDDNCPAGASRPFHKRGVGHPYLRNTSPLRKLFHKGQLRSWHQSTAISAPAAGSRRGFRGHAQAWVEEVRKDIVGLNRTQVHGERPPRLLKEVK